MSPQSIWDVLGVGATTDLAAIRRAYARKLKTTQPEDDPEGFKLLRAAYEAALRIVDQQPPRVDQQGADQQPGATPTLEPDAPAPVAANPAAAAHAALELEPLESELLQLRAALHGLAQLLQAPALRVRAPLPRAAHEYLRTVLHSPLLDNIRTEQQVAAHLARLLAHTLPHSDALLYAAAERFGWHAQAQYLEEAPAVVVARLRDLEFLASLTSTDSPYAAAFASLQRPPVPVLSWLQAHVHRPHRARGHQLLALLRDQHPGLLELLDASAVAWWDRLLERPQPSIVLLTLGLILTGLSLFTMWSLPADERLALPFITAAACAGAILWKLFLVDWPRLLMQRRWPLGAPLALRVGWLPLAAASLLLAALPIETLLPTVLAILALQWTLVAARRVSLGRSLKPNLTTLGIAMGPAALLAGWWLLVTRDFPAAVSAQIRVPGLLLLLSGALGSWEAQASWVLDLDATRRKGALCALLAWCITASVAVWQLAPADEWQPLCAALLLIALCLQRPIHVNQQQLAWLWPTLVIAFAVSASALGTPSILRMRSSAVILLGVVALVCLLAWRSENAGVIERLARSG